MAVLRLVCGGCSLTRGLLTTLTEVPGFVSVSFKQTVAAQLGLPEPPKRPMSPYMRFLNQHRAEYRRKFPDLMFKEVTSKIAVAWKEASEAERNNLEEAYRVDKEAYVLKYEEYMKTVTPKQLSTMKRLKKDIRQKKERRYENKRGRLEKEEHGKPRAPGNAFFLFWMSLDQGELRRKEFLKEAARKWSSLGEEDQRPFFERADKLREQYFGELKEWEAQMAKAGNFHLIRPQHRVVYKLFQVQQDNQQED